MSATERDWYGTQPAPRRVARGAPAGSPAAVANVARWLASSTLNAAGELALEHWKQRVSMRALCSTRLVWSLCLAFAAPVLRRLGEQPHAWCFHGQAVDSGRDELLYVAQCVYGRIETLPTWHALARDEAGVLSESTDGLLVIAPAERGRSALHLEQASTAARLWLDRPKAHGPLTAPRTRCAPMTIFSSSVPFDAWLIRSRWPDGRLRVFDIDADAGEGHGILDIAFTGGIPAGEVAMMAIEAHAAGGQVGVSWLRFLAWCGDDLPAMVRSECGDAMSVECPETDLGECDVARCVRLIAAAGEFATKHGLTGWPAGSASYAGAAMLAAWRQSRGH